MKRTAIIILALIWLLGLLVLIVAMTNILQNNPFKDYRLMVGLGFLVLSGLIRMAYLKLKRAD